MSKKDMKRSSLFGLNLSLLPFLHLHFGESVVFGDFFIEFLLNKAKDSNFVKETFLFMFLERHLGPAHLVGFLILNFDILDVY
jgi:hypothetical protein